MPSSASAWNWRAFVIICGPRISTTVILAESQTGRARVLGDPDELRTAVTNLLDNAVKYSPDGVHIAVELKAPDEEKIVLRVRDQGVGIPQMNSNASLNVFTAFASGRCSRVKGTGLGLFIVRSIAKNHGGRVFAQSDGAGKGTTVTLELPRDSARSHEPRAGRRGRGAPGAGFAL